MPSCFVCAALLAMFTTPGPGFSVRLRDDGAPCPGGEEYSGDTFMVELRIDPRRCLMPNCGGWAVHDGSGLRVSHSPAGQAKQRAGNEARRRGLSLPRLNSTAAARKWLALIGEAVSQGRLKLSVAIARARARHSAHQRSSCPTGPSHWAAMRSSRSQFS